MPQERVIETPKLRYRFEYSDGKIAIKEFESKDDANWFAYNEGDHLYSYRQIHETS